jgi:2-dehydro-3-deoxy-D-arabinonate dehydratase
VLLYRTPSGAVVESDGLHFLVDEAAADAARWDALLEAADLRATLADAVARGRKTAAPTRLLSPVGTQEVWAAGVTYYRSRTARMEESKAAGGGSFYDRVYEADRPELFFKATPGRVIAPGGTMRLRRDSKWMVPEPELALVINSRAQIIGYTVGNDLSCRDIEGENPLYLPQAKVFDGCAALGPAVRVAAEPLPPETRIALSILRGGKEVFAGDTALTQLRRAPAALVEYLYRELSFPTGAFLMTGTGIVPPDEFTLVAGDEMRISIDGVGTLVNTVA